MKIRLIRFFIASYFIYWLLYIFSIILFRTLAHKEFEMLNIALTGLLTSFIIVGFIGLGTFMSLKPKFTFLESSDFVEPNFSSNIKGYYENIDTPFEHLISKIEQKWIITNTNINEKIIKCCSKINIMDWGYGAYLKYDETNKIIHCIFFPFTTSYHKNKFITEFNELIGYQFKIQ